MTRLSRRQCLRALAAAPFVLRGRYDALPQEQQEALRAAYEGSYAFRDRIDIQGLGHPKRVFDLTEGLVRRGHTDRHIELVLGANFERVLSDLWS